MPIWQRAESNVDRSCTVNYALRVEQLFMKSAKQAGTVILSLIITVFSVQAGHAQKRGGGDVEASMRLTRRLRFAARRHSANRTSCIDNAMTVLLVRATASPWLVFCRTTGILYLNWLASLGRTLSFGLL